MGAGLILIKDRGSGGTLETFSDFGGWTGRRQEGGDQQDPGKEKREAMFCGMERGGKGNVRSRTGFQPDLRT